MSFCDTSGRLFELSAKRGLDSEKFVRAYMNSDACRHFDMPFDHLQWAGEQYILAELLDETPVPQGETYWSEAMYWIGYTYRYWHLYTGESSAEIYKQCDNETMNMIYPGYHTLDVAFAIDRIKEANEMKASKS
jgi:hypothetical protein